MANDSPSTEHLSDLDLFERLVSGAEEPHLPICPSCAARAALLARKMENSAEPLTDEQYRLQAAQIRARIGRRKRNYRAPLALAATLALALGLSWMLADRPNRTTDDLDDERLLAEIDAWIDEDPYVLPDEGDY